MVALHDKVLQIREKRLAAGVAAVPDKLQGVSRERVQGVLTELALGSSSDIADAVFALLDNQTESWFGNSAPAGTKFADGATTAHIACHVGILQRASGKLDREGRDYWLKPMREIGALEAITLHEGGFIPGHVKAKSPHSCYRLEKAFVEILRAPENEWKKLLAKWSSDDAARSRKAFQAMVEALAKSKVDSGHADLIQACIEHYVPRFLEGYKVLYVDDSDGDRISADERKLMAEAGIELKLEDAMPDVLLWSPEKDGLWVIEAVTSDGEVDFHKVAQMRAMAKRCGKSGVGFTTAYRTWKEAASRQASQGNLAVGTYMWIHADPAKHYRVEE